MRAALIGVAAAALLFVSLPILSQFEQHQSAYAAAMRPQDFVDKAGMSDMFEIAAGELALEKSKDGQIRTFAAMMVEDHTKASQNLKTAAEAADLTVPATLDAKHKEMMEKLRSATGADFDRTYAEMQVKGHQEALELHRGYARDGENAALKQVAAKMAPIVEGHLNKAKTLSKSSS